MRPFRWSRRWPLSLVQGQPRSIKPEFETLEDRCLLTVLPLFYGYNGANNNLTHPTWGTAGSDLLRTSGTAYGDGLSTLAGSTRPSARDISNLIAEQLVDPEPNSRNMTDMIYAWGQFIDHDLDLTPAGSTESDPIAVPSGDAVFGSDIPFFRALFDSATGTSSPRDQPNVVTSFLDGSMVYGSDATRAAALRTFVGGRMKTSAGNLLPINTGNLPVEVDIPGVDPTTLYLTGDVRGNENIELTAIQTLFVREHNYWAGQLAAQHPGWTDEQLYQGARQIVIAEIQAITFNEFLPALLGSNVLTPYAGYNPNLNPSVAAEFSEAAYRVGHSLLNENVDFFNNDGSESHDPLDFSGSADDPSVLLQDGTSVDNILKYLVADNAQEVDNHVEDAFRNFLFDPTNNAGLDLYAIDIQRGRDLGLPDYNSVRAAYGLPKVTSFAQITSDPTLQAQLQSLYGSVDNIDLFVGGLAEDHVAGGSMGPLFTAIIADQFERLRDGDRFWYQNIFSGPDLQMIQNTTLADVIARNTSINNLQDDVFFFTTGTISGRAFVDTNANGTRDPGEAGMAGVTVQLFDASNTLVASTTTASDGTYEFDNLDQGASFQVKMVLPTGSFKFTTAAGQNVDLVDNSGAGQFRLDFGILPLTPPVPQAAPVFASGADAGGPGQVNVYNPATGALTTTLNPFGTSFHGGVRVAVGDVNGDGVSDVVAAAGPGGGPQVVVFDGKTFQMLTSFYAFNSTFTGGVNVAVGDVNHDGYADIIAGADAGGGPQVTVFSGKDGSVLANFYAFASTFTGGVRVASGDLNGDGFADIITAAGPGGGPQVTVYDGKTNTVLVSFYAMTSSFHGGVTVAAGDINADGIADIITGAGPGGGPQVTVFDGKTSALLASFFALPSSFTGGVRVGAVDVNHDGHARILTAAGPGGSPQVTGYDSTTLALLGSFFAYDPTFHGGAFVAGH